MKPSKSSDGLPAGEISPGLPEIAFDVVGTTAPSRSQARPDGASSFTTRFAVRFGATFTANVVRAGLSFLAGLLVARGLGPAGYGELNFLLASFTAISQLLEMGTSSAFYTFVARRPRSRVFFGLYLGWVAFQFVATLLAVGLLLPQDLVARIWLGHSRTSILLAFLASFLLNQVWVLLSQLSEAVRKTVLTQAASIAQAAVHLVLIAAAMHWRLLTVSGVMWLFVGEYVALAAALGPRLVRANLAVRTQDRDDVGIVFREFADYCAPLVVYGWAGFLYAFGDRWLLQRFGGAEQQGFFAIGQQFANVSLIATTSILRVFWKEIAEAGERGDTQRIRRLYLSVSRGALFAAAWVSGLLIPYSRVILHWSAGVMYDDAWPALSIMFLYPIPQSLGQVTGAFFYASGRTARFVKINMTMMLISIPMTYFVLASRSAMVPGLGLGALGLALKTVVISVLSVNLMEYLITRMNGVDYNWAHQVGVVVPLIALGWLCKWTAGAVVGLTRMHTVQWAELPVAGFLYIAASLALVCSVPGLAGLRRDQIRLGILKADRWADWRRVTS